MPLGLFELRDHAGKTLQQASDWVGVSTGHLWNCENGRGTLTVEQDAGLRAFYLAQIAERAKRFTASLDADNETNGEALNPSSPDSDPGTSPDK